MKVEEAVLGSPSLKTPYGQYGRKATLNFITAIQNMCEIFGVMSFFKATKQQLKQESNGDK